MNRAFAVLWGLTFVALAQADAPVPPPAPPFALPLLDGETRTHEPPPGRMERGALPDPRMLFDLAMGCYPSRSLFRAEIALEGRAARRQAGADKAESRDIREAQKQLGHQTLRMTEHYVRNRRGEKVEPTK